MGPVIGNIGNLQFVLTAVLGGLLSVTGVGGITLGVMASYLQFTKSFTQPFMQVAQQFNAIVMALAGAERIFRLIDEKPEEDEGYVELVNARKDANGNITECKERTGMWAWKHPHSADGSVTYTELTGDVRFEDVTFGYNPDKVILKDISLFANPEARSLALGFYHKLSALCSEGAHDQVYETVRRYGHESGEIWHRMQKNLPGDLAIQGR